MLPDPATPRKSTTHAILLHYAYTAGDTDTLTDTSAPRKERKKPYFVSLASRNLTPLFVLGGRISDGFLSNFTESLQVAPLTRQRVRQLQGIGDDQVLIEPGDQRA